MRNIAEAIHWAFCARPGQGLKPAEIADLIYDRFGIEFKVDSVRKALNRGNAYNTKNYAKKSAADLPYKSLVPGVFRLRADKEPTQWRYEELAIGPWGFEGGTYKRIELFKKIYHNHADFTFTHLTPEWCASNLTWYKDYYEVAQDVPGIKEDFAKFMGTTKAEVEKDDRYHEKDMGGGMRSGGNFLDYIDDNFDKYLEFLRSLDGMYVMYHDEQDMLTDPKDKETFERYGWFFIGAGKYRDTGHYN